MQPNNNHFHYNYYISNNSSVRASLNTNITYNSPQSFKHSPNPHTKFSSPSFNQSAQTVSNKVLPNFKTIKTEEDIQEKQKNKTTFIPERKNNDSKKCFLKPHQPGSVNQNQIDNTKKKEEKKVDILSPQFSELRMTLDVVNFSPRPKQSNFKRETIYSPKPLNSGGSFWKTRRNSRSKTPNNKNSGGKVDFKQKIFVANKNRGINRFRLLKLIGQGTFNDVYLAIDKKTLTLWAIKRLKKSMINTKELKQQFSKIISSNLKLNFPNIIKIYDIFSDQNYVYLVEEFMESGNLEQYIFKKKYQIKQTDIGEKICEINSAIKYIHQNNLIHAGLKPSSILLSHDTCKLSHIECYDSGLLNMATLCNQTNYTPPQALSSQNISPAFDMWCLGLIFYQLYVHKPLFSQGPQKLTMRKILNFKSDDLKLPPEISQQVLQILKSLLDPDPRKRVLAADLMEHSYMMEHRTDNEWNSLMKIDNNSKISSKTLEE